MMLRSFKTCWSISGATALAVFSLATLAGVSNANAADENANAAPADDDADDNAPKAAAEPTTAAKPADAEAAPKKEAALEAPGLIERLPASAYPEPVVRGLHGGSLWLNSQGLQWPYLPRTTIGVSGYAWLDTEYERTTLNTPPTPAKNRQVLQEGRLLLRITPTYSNGDYFVQGQAELVANKNQSQGQPSIADTDDVWIRAGKWKAFDVTVGRFEGFEVYHLGMGLDLNTQERLGPHDTNGYPAQVYGASFLFYRPGGAGNLALHAYPTENLRFELLGQTGTEGIYNRAGVRPAGVFDLGWLKLKAGGEYVVETSPTVGDKSKKESRGFAGSAQFVFDPYVEFGANGGYALVDLYSSVGDLDTGKSTTTTSVGGFLNARVVPDLLVGLGVNDVHLTDQHRDVTTGKFGDYSHLQTFGAIQYFWESQLMIKLVVSYAKADYAPTFTMTAPYTNTMWSGRLRFQYLF